MRSDRDTEQEQTHKEAFLYGWAEIICLHSNSLCKCAIYLKGTVCLKI